MKNIKKCVCKKMKTLKGHRGFTLLEMAIVLFIISALLLIIIPNIGSHRESASETGNEALQTVVDTQAELYELSENTRPDSLEILYQEGYLTEEQLQKAQDSNITVSR